MTTTADTPSRRGDALVANAVALVLGVAAFSVSFTHVMDVAAEHGQRGWVAKAIATSVELMALAAVAEIRRRAAKGEPRWVAVCVLLLGVTMSLAANLATAAPGAWGKAMAAWPAIAFLAVAVLVETRTAPAPDTEQQARTDSATASRTDVPADPQQTRTEPGALAQLVRTDVRADLAHMDAQTRADVRTDERTDLTQRAEDTDPAGFRPAAAASRRETQPPAEPVDQADDASSDTASSDTPALTARASTDTAHSGPESASDTVSDTRPDTPADRVTVDGWQAAATGLLVPSSYIRSRVDLTASERPAPVPGPRQHGPVTPRTHRAARTEQRSVRAASDTRTDVRTESGADEVESTRTDRPTRTQVVAELVEQMRTDPAWRPDYAALMARTGYGRSWLEKRVADARQLVSPAAVA